MKNFWFLKDTAKRMKSQATDWEKISENHIFDKRLPDYIEKLSNRIKRKQPN